MYKCPVCGRDNEKTYALRINLITGLTEGICSEECLKQDVEAKKRDGKKRECEDCY